MAEMRKKKFNGMRDQKKCNGKIHSKEEKIEKMWKRKKKREIKWKGNARIDNISIADCMMKIQCAGKVKLYIDEVQ